MKRLFCYTIMMMSIIYFAAFLTCSPERSDPPAQRNVILIIPDGCSIPAWAAVRILTAGVEGELNIDRLPVQSRARIYSADTIITDSAAAGTAFACGVKTNNGVLGMDAETVRGDSLTGHAVTSILELAEQAGYATGLVTTTSIPHATPAAFYTHRPERDWMELIAGDIIEKDIEVILGGGREYFIPRGTTDEEGGRSRRTDSRNLIEEMTAQGYMYVHDAAGFAAVEPASTDRLIGLFNPRHMCYEYDRPHDRGGEPPLWEMAEKALDMLSKNERGFFLMIEAGMIDQAAHANDAVRWLWDCIACDKTVGVAREFAETHPKTLLIVVPDHGTGGPNVIGFYESTDPAGRILENEAVGHIRYTLDENGFPLDFDEHPLAIGWASSPYFLHIPSGYGEHTAEDVGVHATGPGSEMLTGLNNDVDINAVMRIYLGL
ncbi:alkaline phosphatase [Candidatus Latescibacterota bacterium]